MSSANLLPIKLNEANNILEDRFSGLGFEQLGVGMCSDGLIVNGNLHSQLLTNINGVSTSLKYCSAQVEKTRPIDTLYSSSTSDVFSGVLQILGETGLMEKGLHLIPCDLITQDFPRNAPPRSFRQTVSMLQDM